MKKLLLDLIARVNAVYELLECLLEKTVVVSMRQEQEASRQDIFHNRLISLEAALDHKLEIFGERQAKKETTEEREEKQVVG